jgi:hypothetical protein
MRPNSNEIWLRYGIAWAGRLRYRPTPLMVSLVSPTSHRSGDRRLLDEIHLAERRVMCHENGCVPPTNRLRGLGLP